MHSDRKYIKTCLLNEGDVYAGRADNPGGSFIVSNMYYEGGSTIFNQESRSISTEFKAPSSVGGWMGSGTVVEI